jgi:hypothetical protein
MVVIKPDGPRPATQGDFSYDENGFQVFHLSRETPLELRAIYFPEKKGGYGQAQKDRIKYAARQRKHKVKKSWLKAQLTHYGVEFNPKDKMGDLDLVLKSAIEKGQVRMIPLRFSCKICSSFEA